MVGVGDEVQDGDEHQRGRLREVQMVASRFQDGGGVAEVGLDHRGPVAGGEKRAGMGAYDWVVVDIQHPGVWCDRVGDLVGVALGRNAGADVDELSDAALGGEEPYGTTEKLPVLLCDEGDVGEKVEHTLRRFAVGGEVVLAARLLP